MTSHALLVGKSEGVRVLAGQAPAAPTGKRRRRTVLAALPLLSLCIVYGCGSDGASRDGSLGGVTSASTSGAGNGGQKTSSDTSTGGSGGATLTTVTISASGGIAGQKVSSGGGSSGGSPALSSNTYCTAADCYNLTYQCLDSHAGYQLLRTVDCAYEKSSACGSATCGTRCIKDGDPILCPAGTVCELVYRGTGIPWTYPEDACQPVSDAGTSATDAGPADAATKDTMM